MSFEFVIVPDAKRDVKQLAKKYTSLKDDLAGLAASLKQDALQGEPIGKDCYKIRLAIKSKNKGKSGGARVITCVKVIDETVFLIAVYDKSEMASITDQAIEQRLADAGL